jgi:hypothetical protein
MQSFIVLGIIPGTDIQTNLNFWISVSFLLMAVTFRAQLRAFQKFVQWYLAMRKIASTINRYDFSLAS